MAKANASSAPATTNVYFTQRDITFKLFSINVLSTYDAAPVTTAMQKKFEPHRKLDRRRRLDGSNKDVIANDRTSLPRGAGSGFNLQECVQCGSDYLDDDNFAFSCRFHRLENGKCCLRGTVACSSSSHRPEHHTDFSYAAYDSYLKTFFKYDHQVFARVVSDNVAFDPIVTLSVTAGVTTSTHATTPDKFFLYFVSGHELNQQQLLLFTRDDLLTDGTSIEPLIQKFEDLEGTVEALWIIEDEEIIGVEMHAQSSTMQTPAITRVLFEFNSWTPTPSIATLAILSESHFGELAPPRTLPAHHAHYPNLPPSSTTFSSHVPGSVLLGIPRPRPSQKFQAVSPGNACPLKLTFVSVDCFRSNKVLGGDQFLIVLDVVNSGLEPVKISEINCWWLKRSARKGWNAAKVSEDSVSHGVGGQILGGKWSTLKVFVDVGEGGVARLDSLLFDVELLCQGGSTVSLTLEHTADQIYTIPDPETSSHAYIILESPKTHTTINLDIFPVETSPRSMFSISLLGRVSHVSLNQYRSAVVAAIRDASLEGVVEVLGVRREEYGVGVSVKALVDILSRRVYGIRVDMACDDGAKAARFFTVEPYGDALALDPVYVKECTEARNAVDGIESWEAGSGVSFREQKLVDFIPRLGGGVIAPAAEPSEVVVPVAERSLSPEVEKDLESSVGEIVARQMAEFMAKFSATAGSIERAPLVAVASPVVASSAVDGKLDLILSKLFDLDSRMGQLESQQEADARGIKEKLTTLSAKVEDLSVTTEAHEKTILEAVQNSSITFDEKPYGINEADDIAALEELARRLENVGISAEGLTASVKEVGALNDLADRLEAVAASSAEISLRSAASQQKQEDTKIDGILEALNARMDKMEHLSTISDIVSNGLKQIVTKQNELDADVRSSLARFPPNTPATRPDEEVVSKLNELEARIDVLPQVYREVIDFSLDRQTNSLVAILDGRRSAVDEYAPRAVSPASPYNRDHTMSPPLTPSPTNKTAYRVSMPAVPNFGISSGLSKLSKLAYKRTSTGNAESSLTGPH
ncbi:UNVERIFIED_CONTAM: hypothetical protein HDU68_001630 [Siphonaria sp. JEL0065]|nr:hypothetical protein HDU68_001630 [Siphonaria sp. JEL0065]